MEINYIDVESYPGSEKIYISGSMYPIKVGMRKINLTPTVTFDKDNNKILTENSPIYVYDTSGVFTDKDVKVDINKGVPRVREQWILDRGDVEQLDNITSEYGRQRLNDKSLDAIRFPHQIKPYKAKKGKNITQMAYAKAGIACFEAKKTWDLAEKTLVEYPSKKLLNSSGGILDDYDFYDASNYKVKNLSYLDNNSSQG